MKKTIFVNGLLLAFIAGCATTAPSSTEKNSSTEPTTSVTNGETDAVELETNLDVPWSIQKYEDIFFY